MTHPVTFREDDPMLARVRDAARALPESAEKISHGRPAFFTARVFAYYGGSERIGGDWIEHATALLVRPALDEREALIAEGAWVPAYLGPTGWVGVDLDTGDWAERLDELLDMSYRATAPVRLLRALDAR